MDRYSGYNQINMHPDDFERTVFQSPKGVFCCQVMLFDLKNARATYQRAMTIIFKLLEDTIECYIGDLVVKSRQMVDHLEHLKMVSANFVNTN